MRLGNLYGESYWFGSIDDTAQLEEKIQKLTDSISTLRLSMQSVGPASQIQFQNQIEQLEKKRRGFRVKLRQL